MRIWEEEDKYYSLLLALNVKLSKAERKEGLLDKLINALERCGDEIVTYEDQNLIELELDSFPFDPSEVNPFWLNPLFLMETIGGNLQVSPGSGGS